MAVSVQTILQGTLPVGYTGSSGPQGPQGYTGSIGSGGGGSTTTNTTTTTTYYPMMAQYVGSNSSVYVNTASFGFSGSNGLAVSGPVFAYAHADVEQAITPTVNQTLSMALGNEFYLTLANSTTLTFTTGGLISGRNYTFTFYCLQSGAGSFTITWPASVKWSGGSAPVLTTTTAKMDIITLMTRDGGTTFYGGQVVANA